MPTASVPSSNPRQSRTTNTRLAALPKESRDKFERLRQTEARTAAMRDGLLDQRHRVRAELEDTQRALGRFDREHQPEAAFTYEEDPKTGGRKRVPAVFSERIKLVEQIGAMREEMAQIDNDIAAANVGYSTDSILSWLHFDVPTTAKFAAIKPKFVVNKGETLADALELNRQEQAAVSEQIAELEAAHITISEARSRMIAEVNALAERGRPDVTGVLFGGNVEWPTRQLVTEVHGEGHSHVGTATVEDALALSIWACREEIVAKLSAEIEVTGDDKTAVSAADRPHMIAANKVKLLELQHVAEAIMCRMEAAGQFVTRACANPLVLLGMDDGTLSARPH